MYNLDNAYAFTNGRLIREKKNSKSMTTWYKYQKY